MTRTLLPWNTRTSQWFDAVRREMDELVTRLHEADPSGEELASFSPRTNVAETDTHYEITLDLPGLKPEDFNVELHDGRLSISGERSREQDQNGKTWHRYERYYGKFRRTFILGQEVDDNAVEATYNNGVLTVMVPKSPKAQPKKIAVHA